MWGATYPAKGLHTRKTPNVTVYKYMGAHAAVDRPLHQNVAAQEADLGLVFRTPVSITNVGEENGCPLKNQDTHKTWQ